MKQIGIHFRLTAMRHRAGTSLPASLRLAAGLLWRNHQTSLRRRHLERRAAVEHAARQRL